MHRCTSEPSAHRDTLTDTDAQHTLTHTYTMSDVHTYIHTQLLHPAIHPPHSDCSHVSWNHEGLSDIQVIHSHGISVTDLKDILCNKKEKWHSAQTKLRIDFMIDTAWMDVTHTYCMYNILHFLTMFKTTYLTPSWPQLPHYVYTYVFLSPFPPTSPPPTPITDPPIPSTHKPPATFVFMAFCAVISRVWYSQGLSLLPLSSAPGSRSRLLLTSAQEIE